MKRDVPEAHRPEVRLGLPKRAANVPQNGCVSGTPLFTGNSSTKLAPSLARFCVRSLCETYHSEVRLRRGRGGPAGAEGGGKGERGLQETGVCKAMQN